MRAAFIIGAGFGYVLGAKAGRERYEQIRKAGREIATHPAVRAAAANVREQAGVMGGKAAHKAGEVGGKAAQKAGEVAHEARAKTGEMAGAAREKVNGRRGKAADEQLMTM
ncbi:YtxH domain-containing protein [Actinocorallia longicatena]|uniref:YtxH-like protein n=1 Tax=Actinocorallia longicatena TaxID=111803 RepID=A0ABP6QNR6_9ACTN